MGIVNPKYPHTWLFSIDVPNKGSRLSSGEKAYSVPDDPVILRVEGSNAQDELFLQMRSNSNRNQDWLAGAGEKLPPKSRIILSAPRVASTIRNSPTPILMVLCNGRDGTPIGVTVGAITVDWLEIVDVEVTVGLLDANVIVRTVVAAEYAVGGGLVNCAVTNVGVVVASDPTAI